MTLGPDDCSLVIRRRIAATPEELFDAWMDADGMREWMCPGSIRSVEVRMESRVGGELVVIMRDADKTYEHKGQFTILDRPSKLAFTWIAAATDMQPTLVTVEFRSVTKEESEIVLRHERFPRKEPTDQYRGGWGQILACLDAYMQTRRHM
jgi:uncharacterized protein YndB with AHSA1/START domain